MSKQPPILLALALALALPMAASCVQAQEITTSRGLRTLPRTDGMTGEAQLRQAERIGEEVVSELLQDVAAYDGRRTALASDRAAIPGKVSGANAEYTRAKEAFDQANQRYRQELDAFNQRQVALQADVERQRASAAAINPTAMQLDQYNAAVAAANAWATRIGNERTAIEAERGRLQASHDQIEAERARLEKERLASEARLKQSRDSTTTELGGTEQKRKAAYAQLQTATDYLRAVRAKLSGVSRVPIGTSAILEQATAKLKAYKTQ